MSRPFRQAFVAGAFLAACAAPAEMPGSDEPDRVELAQEAGTTWEYLARLYDADSDGRIVRAEYPRSDEHWSSLDADANGFVTQEEIEARRPFWRDPGRKRPEAPPFPGMGEVAPPFELAVLEDAEGRSVSLTSFQGTKPVALIFGSYT